MTPSTSGKDSSQIIFGGKSHQLSSPSNMVGPERPVKPAQAFKISRRDRERSLRGRMPNSREMASDSSSRETARWRSPGWLRARRVSE